MISKRHCPQTGVTNFFAASEPLIAIGSVSEGAGVQAYAWHCYLDTPVSGTAQDAAIAEAELRHAIERRRSPSP
jgi:hypothetical protein